MKRRIVLSLISSSALAVAGSIILFGPRSSAKVFDITVYRDPNCGCCGNWANHVKAAGFVVAMRDIPHLLRIKTEFGVPKDLHSCHTAMVDGYVVEGHVPAAAIKRLLSERPEAHGIAVPGMPIGSPGMEQGSMREPYDVILFGPNGERSIFARH